ncbi:type II toxin-antitoxin system ParD family antitoxin [Burkholderia cenocepacia]|jgi:antitoxin ParD1/3/4|uniref:Type II toxin-antitoxin system ParD family antitoxin n=1 Tax=Burkholderia cenocepacia TaxID=95486 RepID=A0AAW4TAK0_9BURK|nr:MULTISPECIES: type II toxin-antitoxin system ParD family antitoxin [Burkholderia cepacia complex]AQQ26525.1 CopG family transcriptional regulator [Burkholderia cenocepacia]MBR8040770.1 type II toxin-antitoxin system ParD family antitoxin [Burkholderia cenocepacia]MBR8074204.1 type II toxin-antitoxin system ParD family antitoxin [Burkholderia cenocepacia]MBR8196209.1 type II toxin-antitoxin system ParD family antitoxin [Burkholderia cenocepacia]MBR8294602.1 type II toxin-antitoxin system Par
MSRKAPVSQDDHVAEYVDADGLSERCSDSDTMRARLRLLESRNAQVRALQDALDAGEASGHPNTFDGETFLARMRAQRVAAKAGHVWSRDSCPES